MMHYNTTFFPLGGCVNEVVHSPVNYQQYRHDVRFF